MQRIGERIKRKRESLNFQLNDLAKKVGISSSALSQIENAKVHPSIFTLKNIADSLSTSISELIGENEIIDKNPIIKKEDIKFVEKNESGTKVFILSHFDIHKQTNAYIIRFSNYSNSNNLFIKCKGEIFGYVLQGNITFQLNKNEYLLSHGDSFYFNSQSNYYFKNNCQNTCELLWVISSYN